jgi:hypothetical protein
MLKMKNFEEYINESKFPAMDGDAIEKLKAQNKKLTEFVNKLKELVKNQDHKKLQDLDWNITDSEI